MSAVLNPYEPLVSEFENATHEAAYLARLRANVAASYADPRPRVPHDQALKRLRTTVASNITHVRRDYP